MPREIEPPDTYMCDVAKTVEDKMVDMVNNEIAGILKQEGMTEIKPLVAAIKQVNETIAWVANGDKELYSKFEFHIFRNHEGSYLVVQGKEVPTKDEPRNK